VRRSQIRSLLLLVTNGSSSCAVFTPVAISMLWGQRMPAPKPSPPITADPRRAR
jgi:hypothetical protein